MNKIMMSIKPQYVAKIFNGEKTIEIRRTHPSIDMPFKVYVYETKAQFVKSVRGACTTYGYGRGKVIGSFVCDKVDEYSYSNLEAQYRINDMALVKTCLNHPELIAYGKGKTLRGLHITEPKLFDKPKELSEFRVVCHRTIHCRACEYVEVVWHEDEQCFYYECRRPSITHQPRSFCYVEDV